MGIGDAVSTILGSAKEKQATSIFKTGGDDEPTYPILSKFLALGLKLASPVIEIQNIPTENIYKLCEEAGSDIGQLMTREKNIK